MWGDDESVAAVLTSEVSDVLQAELESAGLQVFEVEHEWYVTVLFSIELYPKHSWRNIKE